MSRLAFTITSAIERTKALDAVAKAPLGMHFTLREATRSLEQNDLMWLRLRDLSKQVDWYGEKLTANDWKDMMTAGLRRSRIVRNIDGDGFVQIGLHTSDLSTPEMTALLDLMDAFGANHGVKFTDQQDTNSSGETSQAAAIHDDPETTTPAAAEEFCGDAAAGVTNLEASDLSDDWRHVYVTCLSGRRDKAESLHKRHEQALQMIGGAPNAGELAWMRRAWRLVEHRNKSRLQPGEYDRRLAELLNMPLPLAAEAA
jgi:NinB protein